MVGFMNPEFLGAGFDSLRFRANLRETRRSSTCRSTSSTRRSPTSTIASSTSGDFAIGAGFPPTSASYLPLELIFDWTGSEQGDGFGVDLIVGLTPVPEPSTALLLALGLAVLAARARRRRGAAI